jgi:hypothetical protein
MTNNILRSVSLGFIIGLTTLATGCLDGMDEGFAPDSTDQIAYPPTSVDRPQPGRPRLPDRESELPADREGDPDQPLPSAERPVEPCKTELELLAAHEAAGGAGRVWDPTSGEACVVRPSGEEPAEPTIAPGSGGDPASDDRTPKPAQVLE